jgi:UDP-N-acetylmuramate--alanine ligase
MDPDLSSPRRIHLVGAGGAGMGAIAAVLHAMGHTVSGSDLKGGPVLERLRVEGMEMHVGHDPDHVGDAELVAISTAIPDRNPEVVTARERNLPVLRRSDLLPAISAQRRTIVVAGTHGKTTTSSMLAIGPGRGRHRPLLHYRRRCQRNRLRRSVGRRRLVRDRG